MTRDNSKRVRSGGGSSALPKAKVDSHRFTARLIDPISFGTVRITTGSDEASSGR